MPTVAEIKDELEATGVEIPADARKADLEALLDSLSDTPTVDPGGIDPSLVKARDEARERETPPGRVRPVPATIDPRLVEIREQTIAAEAANADRSTTEPPAR